MTPGSYSFTVEKQDEGKRIDAFLADMVKDLTRSAAQQLIEQGAVVIDARPCGGKSRRVAVGERIELEIPPLREAAAFPENIPLDIVYEDEQLLVVNKPKGMVVHPAPGNEAGTLVNALLYHCRDGLSGINGTARPGIVHRIDKDTSGLLAVAKTDEAHLSLAQQLARHDMQRAYRAVVYGALKEDEGKIDAPIGRNPKDRKKMAVNERCGKPAVTHYQILRRFKNFSYIECRLETGRTHQIRVHMAYIGHPLAGDAVYGPKRVITALKGQCLHAKSLGFVHPVTGENMYFDSELPVYFKNFLETLEKESRL